MRKLIATGIASLALALTSCSSTAERKPINPPFEQQVSTNSEWNKYVTDCHYACLRSWKEPLDGQEEKFPDIQTALRDGYLLIYEEKMNANEERERKEKEEWQMRHLNTLKTGREM